MVAREPKTTFAGETTTNRTVPVLRNRAPNGMTLVELLVVLILMAIVLTVGVFAVGRMKSADLNAAGTELGAGVHYAFNLSSVNNSMYALYLDLDGGSYWVGEVPQENECDRLLLSLDGSDDEQIVKRFGDKEDDDDTPQPFAGLATTGGPNPSSGSQGANLAESTSFRNRSFMDQLSPEVREAAAEEARNAGLAVNEDTPGTERPTKRVRKNRLAKARTLPKGVRIARVVLRENGDPIDEGTVPILIYPHGFLQRALIYLEAGSEDDPEEITLELMSYQGRAIMHGKALDPSLFAEELL